MIDAAPVNWWDTPAAAALLGALAGALAVTWGSMMIELYFKPLSGRKRVARVLFAEVRLNKRILESIGEDLPKHPGMVPDTTHLSTRGWDAVASEIHHLPSEVLKKAVLQYARFDEVNLLARNSLRRSTGF